LIRGRKARQLEQGRLQRRRVAAERALLAPGNGNIAKTVALNGLDGSEWHLQGVGNFAGDLNSDLMWISNSGASNIWEVNGPNVHEIPLNVPTGSSLQLKAATQSQSAATTERGFALTIQPTSAASPTASDPAQLARGRADGYRQGGPNPDCPVIATDTYRVGEEPKGTATDLRPVWHFCNHPERANQYFATCLSVRLFLP
jgi:hypothetical protein